MSVQKFLFLTLLLLLTACQNQESGLESATQQTTSESRPDFEQFFIAQGVEGSFVLYDESANHFIHYNEARNHKRFIPASTFKIPNALIGLESGVIRDKDHVIQWDGTEHPFSSWNQDHTLETAVPNSVVWYFQALAREVGAEEMKRYVNLIEYGNQNISGGIDLFWLAGELRISPVEQIAFLQKLYHLELPISERSMTIVKEILVVEETAAYRLSAKTGFGLRVDPKIGWWVGYLERKNHVYYFALNIESPAPTSNFQPARETIVRQIFKELELLSS